MLWILLRLLLLTAALTAEEQQYGTITIITRCLMKNIKWLCLVFWSSNESKRFGAIFRSSGCMAFPLMKSLSKLWKQHVTWLCNACRNFQVLTAWVMCQTFRQRNYLDFKHAALQTIHEVAKNTHNSLLEVWLSLGQIWFIFRWSSRSVGARESHVREKGGTIQYRLPGYKNRIYPYHRHRWPCPPSQNQVGEAWCGPTLFSVSKLVSVF